MSDALLLSRSADNSLWTTIVFFVFMAIIAVIRITNDRRFVDFMSFVFSNSHIHVYKDVDTLYSGFMVSLFIIQMLAYGFFIQLAMYHFKQASMNDWVLYIIIVLGIMLFFICKLLIDKIVGVVFKAEKLINQYNFIKANYRSYTALFLLPISFIMYYHDIILKNTMVVMIYFVIIVNVLLLIAAIKKFQKLILDKIFYFILYLCAQEIAPYFFIYFLFNNLSMYKT